MKSQLKKLFVPALASRPISALATSIFGRGTPIFMLHRIKQKGSVQSGTTPEHLRNCLQYLVTHGYTFVSLEQVIHALKNKSPLPDNAVAFTMDDGFTDQADIAAPIFLEYGCPLTFFVITGLVDETLWPWDARISWIINNSDKKLITIDFEDETLSIKLGRKDERHGAREQVRNIVKEMDSNQIPQIISRLAKAADIVMPDNIQPDFQPLTWDKARELEVKGIRFAPHSTTHRILSKLSNQAAKEEITHSWNKLKNELNNPLKVFCYPTGRVLDFGPREIAILKEHEFLGATSTIPGYVNLNEDTEKQIFQLPRFELPDNMIDFIQCCSWIEHAKIAS